MKQKSQPTGQEHGTPIQVFYADRFGLQATGVDMRINAFTFGLVPGAQGIAGADVMAPTAAVSLAMSPVLAVKLHEALGKMIVDFEARYGTIPGNSLIQKPRIQ